MKKLFPLGVIIIIAFVFFWQFIVKGFLPIPGDTIVGLYYPFRDIYSKTNPNGVPFKNFLITDPVRQQYPWRSLAVNVLKKGELPVWNPYNLTGTPLLANSQSAVFYPFNILFFLLPFTLSWSILIFLGPLLAGLFTYLYLNNLKLNKFSSIMGAIAFSFCGFSVAWMEWGTVLNTALWLPLTLLSIDKIRLDKKYIKLFFLWSFVFIFSLTSSFLAGHLQFFFYVLIFSCLYIIGKIILQKNRYKLIGLFLVLLFITVLITAIQWLPILKFIMLSARNIDIQNFNTPGWFMPWQNIVQLVVPDFFGNPTTLNYWGVWNYGEFSSYVGILPLIMAFFALFFRRDKKTFAFGFAFFLSLIFILPTFFAKIPFDFKIPFLSTSQPTRLLFVTDFTLSVLGALGLDYFIKLKDKKIVFYVLGIFLAIFSALWLFILFFHGNLLSPENLYVSKQNLIFPTLLFLTVSSVLITLIFYPKNRFRDKVRLCLFCILILITVFDLFRFFNKFTPFTEKDYLFPSSSVMSFLQKQNEPFRVLSLDSRILPPNFSIMYKIQTIEGYDPLYLQRFGELMAASLRNTPDIHAPFGFNRIITSNNYSSRISGLLNNKFILSIEDKEDKNLKLMFRDGNVRVYENLNSLPRAFFVQSTLVVSSKQQAINAIFDEKHSLGERAVIEDESNYGLSNSAWSVGKINFVSYEENKIIIKTKNNGKGFMVITDSFYPAWHVKINGKEEKIYLTDYNFRGVIVPDGENTIEFYNTLF